MTTEPGQPRAEVHEDPVLFEMAADPTLVARSLVDDYLVPPFTLLDTRQGYWQERVRQWKGLGIESEIGRGEDLTFGLFDESRLPSVGSTSIFDPVLTELAYRWYSPPGGIVLDPFAGGSVRGIIASALGRSYCGIELRAEQVEANIQQSARILNREPLPRWIAGDSHAVLGDAHAHDIPMVDMIFTCPPYADLEVYSDDPADLSNMTATQFSEMYLAILGRALERLRRDRFAVVVVGRLRDKRGYMRDLVAETITAMEIGGARFYDEGILMNSVGTGAVRARKQMEASRKLVRLHQHVLIFVKGDARAAAARIAGGIEGGNDAEAA